MTIYIDVVLIENLIMNYIIIYATAIVLKNKKTHLRFFLASMLGAIYTIIAYMPILEIYSNIILKILLSIIIVYIAYNPQTVKKMWKDLVIFYLVSFALGGCAFALLYLVRPQDIFMKDGVYIGTYPIKIALLGGIVGFVVTYIAFKVVKTRMTKNELIYDMVIKIKDKELTTKVMLDTGNMLKDPISNMPVVLVEKSILYPILPKELLENSKNILGGDFKENEDINNEYRTRLRIIPFTSVGKENGMILGIKTDEVKVFTDVEEIVKKHVVVGIHSGKFSRNNKYFGLIGLELLEGSEKNEYITNT